MLSTHSSILSLVWVGSHKITQYFTGVSVVPLCPPTGQYDFGLLTFWVCICLSCWLQTSKPFLVFKDERHEGQMQHSLVWWSPRCAFPKSKLFSTVYGAPGSIQEAVINAVLRHELIVSYLGSLFAFPMVYPELFAFLLSSVILPGMIPIPRHVSLFKHVLVYVLKALPI